MKRAIWERLRSRSKLLVLTAGLAAAMLVTAACTGSATPTNALAGGTVQVGGTDSPSSLPPTDVDTLTKALAGGRASPSVTEIASSEIRVGSQIVSVPPGPVISEVMSRSETTAPAIQYNTTQQVGIWVSGRGEVTATPDLAILSVGVEARADTVAEARSQAAEAMDGLVQALRDRGIAEVDIQTRFFNISPEYIFNERIRRQELTGFRVSNQVTVRIRDVENAGPIVDEVAAAAGDLVRVQGISFTIEDSSALESQAREKAMADLLAKAQQFAVLGGVVLGQPVFLTESGGFVPMVTKFAGRAVAEAAAAPAFDTSISAGELTVAVSVQGVFSMGE